MEKFKYTHVVCNCLGEKRMDGGYTGHIGLWLVDDFTIKPQIDDEIEYEQSRFGTCLLVKINGVLVYEWTKELQNKYDREIELQTKNILKSTRERLKIK